MPAVTGSMGGGWQGVAGRMRDGGGVGGWQGMANRGGMPRNLFYANENPIRQQSGGGLQAGGMQQPGRPPWGGLSGAMGVGQSQRSPAWMTFMDAMQRGGQRAGMKPPKAQEPPNFMGGMLDFGSRGPLNQMAAPGMRPGMRGGMGMQTGAGFGGRMGAMGLEPAFRRPGAQGQQPMGPGRFRL